ncbi:MAG: hypothetical protein AAGU74_02610 [Bacillota bacterium]
MAFDGIGGKMIIHKATDVARDAASQQRRADLMQSMIGKQVQNDEFQKQMQVQDLYQPSEAILQRERNKKEQRSGSRYSGAAAREEEAPENTPQGGITTDENGHKRIDIRI